VDGVAGPRTRQLLAQLVNARRNASSAPSVRPEPAPAKRPADAPVAASPVTDDDGAGVPWLALLIAAGALGLAAALLARMGVPLLGRRGPGPAVVPLGKGIELAGESEDPEIGRFSGVAYAVEIPDVRDPAKRAHSSRFYVLDPQRKLPFWVRYSEVETPLPPALQAHPDPWGGNGALQPGASVLGYVTVPTACPERHAELFAQIELIEAHCKRRGFRLVGVVRDEDPADHGTFERPGIAYALEQFAADSASALVVSDVRRLGRSRSEIDELLGRLSGRGVSLVALDPGLDTTTAEGTEAVRTIAAAGAEPAPVARRMEPFARRMRRPGGGAAAGGNGARRQGEVETVGAAER
jgi:hypothetical protein